MTEEGMPKQQRKEPHYASRVLLIAAESPLRPLISTFLSTMRCACVIVSTAQQLVGLQQGFDAVLIDLANTELSAEQAIVNLRELYPSLAEKILAFSSGKIDPEMVEVIERFGLHHISRETLLPQIWATLREFVAGARIYKPPSIEVAQLMFDSFLTQSQAGVRSLHESGRHLAYRCKNKIVDILITPDVEANRVSLAGQVIGVETGRKKTDGLVVLLTDGMKTIARTNTNQHGEFQLEFEIMQDAGLQIRLGAGSWAAIGLGKVD